MSGNIFKSAAWTLSFSNILTVIVPFDKENMKFTHTLYFFAFVPQTMIIGTVILTKDSCALRKVQFSWVQKFEVFLDTKNLKVVFLVAEFYNSPVIIF